jgi:hypothetical protein
MLHSCCLLFIVFQQLEVDYCITKPRQDVHQTQALQVPVVRLYGVNDAGKVGLLASAALQLILYHRLNSVEQAGGMWPVATACCKKCIDT